MPDPELCRLLDAMDLAVRRDGDAVLGHGVGEWEQRAALRLDCLTRRLGRDPATSACLQTLARGAAGHRF